LRQPHPRKATVAKKFYFFRAENSLVTEYQTGAAFVKSRLQEFCCGAQCDAVISFSMLQSG
jgi:hypothetical protein